MGLTPPAFFFRLFLWLMVAKYTGNDFTHIKTVLFKKLPTFPTKSFAHLILHSLSHHQGFLQELEPVFDPEDDERLLIILPHNDAIDTLHPLANPFKARRLLFALDFTASHHNIARIRSRRPTKKMTVCFESQGLGHMDDLALKSISFLF